MSGRRRGSRPVSLGYLPKAEPKSQGGRSSVQVALETNNSLQAEVDELLRPAQPSGAPGDTVRPARVSASGRAVSVEHLALIGAVSGLGALVVELSWVISGLVR